MDTKLVPALQGLVDAGTLTLEQALATQQALNVQPITEGLAPSAVESHSRRAIISEALTYIGFVFVIAASALLTNQAWENLGRWGRPALFAAGAAILFSAGLWIRQARQDDSGRRLSSTLFVGSEALVAGTTALLLTEWWVPKNPAGMDPGNINWQERANWVDPAIVTLTAVSALAVGLIAYLMSRSALGQIGMAAPSAAMVIAFGQLVLVWTSADDQVGPSRLGFGLLFTGGLMWLWLASQGYSQEKVVGQVLGIGALYVGLQGMQTDLKVWISSLVLIALGLSLLSIYLSNRSWPFLVGGIIGMFGGGVRMLVEYVHGTSGALASLALGILLVIFGVRIVGSRQQVMAVHADSVPLGGVQSRSTDGDEIDEVKDDISSHRNVEPF